MILRILRKNILEKTGTGKAIIVLGPGQTGETTLLTQICNEQGKWLLLNYDDPVVRSGLENANEKSLQTYSETKTMLVSRENYFEFLNHGFDTWL